LEGVGREIETQQVGVGKKKKGRMRMKPPTQPHFFHGGHGGEHDKRIEARRVLACL